MGTKVDTLALLLSITDTTNDDTAIEKEIISDKNIVDQNENNIQNTHINITTDKINPEKLDTQ